MDASAAQTKYQRASALFARGDHAAALALLDELLEAFPGDAALVHARDKALAAVWREDSPAGVGAPAVRAGKHSTTSKDSRVFWAVAGGGVVCMLVAAVPILNVLRGQHNEPSDTSARQPQVAEVLALNTPHAETGVGPFGEAPVVNDSAEASPVQTAHHWAYDLPPDEQTRLVTVTLSVSDPSGMPLPTEVLAICQPWGFRQHKGTDATGRLIIKGPAGDWSFHACARTPQGPFLLPARQVRITRDTTIELELPNEAAPLLVVSERGVDVLYRLRNRDLRPGEECCYLRSYLIPLSAAGFPASLTGGDIAPGSHPMAVHIAPQEDCIIGIVAAPLEREPGYAVSLRRTPGKDAFLVLDEKQLSTVELDIGHDWPDMHLEVIALDQHEVPIYLYVPLVGAGRYSIRMLPGTTRLALRTQHGTFVPTTYQLTPGGRVTLAFGGPFKAKPVVLRWEPGYFSVWFDITDSLGNYVFTLAGSAHLTLHREGKTVYDGEVTAACGRVAEVIPDWGQDWADKPIEYAYEIESPLTGRLVDSGTLEPHQTIDADLRRVCQTDLFEVFARERTENGVRVAEAFESLHSRLSSVIAGPVRPAHGGRFRIQFACPLGVIWSSGDVICLDIYSAHWLWPTACGEAVMPVFHEFGHSYSGVPPRSLPHWGISEQEGFPTWLAYHGIRELYGERAYQMARMEHNTALLTAPAGQAHDGFMFVLDYVDQKHGMGINRDLYRCLYAGQGNLRTQVEGNPALKTEHERLAVLHSALTSENLAWLYRWGRFDVSDGTVEQGLRLLEFRTQLTGTKTANETRGSES